MIVHAYYEEDPRVRREAEALIAPAGKWTCTACADRAKPTLRWWPESICAACRCAATRGPVCRCTSPSTAPSCGGPLAATRAHRRRRYGLVEVHSLPDYLVFAALPMKLSGVPVLLDLHEAMPEFFRSRFPKAANPISYRLLRLQERLSIALANEVMTVNEPLAERLRGLGVKPDRLTVSSTAPTWRCSTPPPIHGASS